MAPSLLICGFAAFSEAPRNPAQATVQRLRDRGWAPAGVETRYLVVPVTWRGSVEAIEAELRLRPADAVLVVGVAVSAEAFHVERVGRNVACDRPDDSDEGWSLGCVAEGGAAEHRVTAPTRSIAAAIERTGLPVQLSDDAGDYLCNFTLYRLLASSAAPALGFLHVPLARECAEGARFSLGDIETAVRAAAEAMAQALNPPDAVTRSA